MTDYSAPQASAPTQDETDATKQAQMWQMLSQGLKVGMPAFDTVAGAALGSIVPGIGTAAGGAAGGAIGTGLGQLYGATVDKLAVEPEQKKADAIANASELDRQRILARKAALDQLLGPYRRYL